VKPQWLINLESLLLDQRIKDPLRGVLVSNLRQAADALPAAQEAYETRCATENQTYQAAAAAVFYLRNNYIRGRDIEAEAGNMARLLELLLTRLGITDFGDPRGIRGAPVETRVADEKDRRIADLEALVEHLENVIELCRPAAS